LLSFISHPTKLDTCDVMGFKVSHCLNAFREQLDKDEQYNSRPTFSTAYLSLIAGKYKSI